jgi:hypothetical protein
MLKPSAHAHQAGPLSCLRSSSVPHRCLLHNSPKQVIQNFASHYDRIRLDLLKKPEYIHIVLNHLPIYGTILGALALAISLILRSRAAQITALILTLVAGVSAYPVFVTGQRAYKTIRGVADDAGADVLDEHMDRAEKTIGAFYLLAALAIAGLLVPIKWPRSAVPLAALTLVVAILCSGIAVYIAQPGGRIRHPEFRPSENSNSSF